MEISDINKVANRKRLNTDVEKLRDKVSRETTHIIKLKVGQDTIYWDLKEKLKQVEGNHERLQQNMAEVQMQHETLSDCHQDELLRRPETLNRVVGTRSICEVVEEYAARLKETVTRTRVESAALAATFDAATRRLREQRAEQAQNHLARRNDADRALHLRQQLDATKHALQEKDELVAELRAAARRSEQVFEVRLLHVTAAIARQEKEVLAMREAAGEADERARHDAADVHELRLQLQEAMRGCEEAARRADELDQRRQAMALSLPDNEQELAAVRAAASDLTERLTTAEAQRVQLESEVKALAVDADRRTTTIEELATAKRSLKGRIDKLQEEFEAHRRSGEAKIAELREEVAYAGRSLYAKTETITRLTDDVRAGTEARAKLQGALAAALADQRRLNDRADTHVREKDGEAERNHSTATLPPPAPAIPTTPTTPAAPAAPALLYDFLSDSSVDGETLNASEVRRRFEALSVAARSGHGFHPSPRPRHGPAARPAPPPPAPRFAHGAISLSQVKNYMKTKNGAFFKNKRFDIKAKKPK